MNGEHGFSISRDHARSRSITRLSFLHFSTTFLDLAYAYNLQEQLLCFVVPPLYLNSINPDCLPQPKMNPSRALSRIAVTSINITNLHHPPSFPPDTQSTGITIQPCTDQL